MFDEFGINAGYVEELHTRWLQSPHSVEEDWRRFFEGTDGAPTSACARRPAKNGRAAHTNGNGNGATNGNGDRRQRDNGNGNGAAAAAAAAVAAVVRAPLGGRVPRGRPRDGHRRDRAAEPRRSPRQRVPRARAPLRERRPSRGAHPRRARARALALRPERGRPRQDVLHRRHGRACPSARRCARSSLTSRRRTARSIGVEYTHIEEPEPRLWLQQQMESTRNRALARSTPSCSASSRS